MGSGQTFGAKEASLVVEFAATDREQCLGDQIEWSAEYCKVPASSHIPKLEERGSEPIRLPGGRTFQVPDFGDVSMHRRLNPDFYHELANYVFIKRLVRMTRLVVKNIGDSPANDVRLEILVPNGSGFGIIPSSNIPSAPKRRKSNLDMTAMRQAFARTGSLHIEKADHETKLEIEFGNLQPGRMVWTDKFHIAVIQSGEVQLSGKLFAANLTKPQEFSLSINAQIARTEMTVAALLALDEPNDDDDDD